MLSNILLVHTSISKCVHVISLISNQTRASTSFRRAKKGAGAHKKILCNVGNRAPFFSNGGAHMGHLFSTSTGSDIVERRSTYSQSPGHTCTWCLSQNLWKINFLLNWQIYNGHFSNPRYHPR